MGHMFPHSCYNSNVYIVTPLVLVFAYNGVEKQVCFSPFSGSVVYGEGARDNFRRRCCKGSTCELRALPPPPPNEVSLLVTEPGRDESDRNWNPAEPKCPGRTNRSPFKRKPISLACCAFHFFTPPPPRDLAPSSTFFSEGSPNTHR